MSEGVRLRVMYVVGNSVIGGAENHVITLVAALRKLEFPVAVVCPRPGPLVDALKALGVRAHLIDMVRPAPDDEYEVSLPAMGELAALMRRWRPDVVHSHLYPAFVHGSLAGQLSSVPALVTTAHTLIVRAGDAWLTKLTATRIIAVSQAAKMLLVEGGVAPRAIHVIYNGIEPRYFDDETASAAGVRARLGIPEDAPVIGTIARLSAEKGHRELLHIAHGVLQRKPEARFLIVGTGPLADELETQAAKLGIKDRVLFTGARRDRRQQEHVYQVVEGCDVARRGAAARHARGDGRGPPNRREQRGWRAGSRGRRGYGHALWPRRSPAVYGRGRESHRAAGARSPVRRTGPQAGRSALRRGQDGGRDRSVLPVDPGRVDESRAYAASAA
jgi:glycosyltransferase involved in cell wall biosynthesis